MKKIIFSLALIVCSAYIQVSAQNLITISRDSFSLQHPEKWKIDKADEDYDPDALFSIEAPDDETIIMFFVFNLPIDADMMLDAQVESFSKSLIKKPEISTFNEWGKYKGKGKILKGKLMGVFKGSVRLFFYGDEHKSFLVMEQFYDSIDENIKAELSAIAGSFSFKN